MANVIVVTGPENAAGFRLAGVDVCEVDDPAKLDRVVGPLIRDRETGIIAINEEFLPLLDPDLLREIERTYRPILIPIPAGRARRGVRTTLRGSSAGRLGQTSW